MNRTLFLFFVLPLFAGKPPAPKPEVPVPASFHNLPPEVAGQIPERWWKAFGDPLLDDLMDRAGRVNLDVRRAASRLAEVRQSRNTSRAALLPNVDSSASVTQLRGGFNQGVARVPDRPAQAGSFVSPFETSILSGGMNLRWEADVFGRLRKSYKAAGADARAAEENIAAVQTIVRAEVARNYIDMRTAEQQMAIVRAHIASEKDLLDLLRARFDAGLASDLDVQRQIAQLANVNASLPDLDAQRLQAAHRISVLLGEEPSALLDRLQKAAKDLTVPPVPNELPGELLRSRPDLRRADAEIQAAYARAGAARADLYPKFVITGLSGRQSTDAPGLTLGAGNFFAAGPGVSLPIFNFGRIRSQIAARDAQLEQALRSYEKDVLEAYEETENALVARDRTLQRKTSLEAGAEAAKRSVDMAQELYVRGLGDFLAVLDAQRSHFEMERALSTANGVVLRQTVGLYQALGR